MTPQQDQTPPGQLAAIACHGWAPSSAPVALFLHGYGSNEQDLTALAQALPEGTQWASLRAPLPIGPGGFAWFPIVSPGRPDPEHLAAATATIWAWIDAHLPAGTSVVPIGFSQGGLMASQLLRTQPERVTAPIILGGFVTGEEQPADAVLAQRLPAVFSGRGMEDEVITRAAVAHTDEWLPAHTTVTSRVYPGLGHGINAEELADVQEFLHEHLAG